MLVTTILAVCAFETAVHEAALETGRLQERLADRCEITQYADKVRTAGGTNVWTDALQTALDEHEIVRIPPSPEAYYVDRSVVVPSNRRIEATGATVRLLPGVRTLLLRNRNTRDGTLAPIPSGNRDTNIAIVGGHWEDWWTMRAGHEASGRYDPDVWGKGRWMGVSTFFLFNNCDHLTIRDVTFHRTSGFAVQAGDGDAHVYRGIRFDRCFADGLHLNGNLSRVLVKDVAGDVGDDLVALNAYDWLNSSVNFGPQRRILLEDLELKPRGGKAYPAIRIQPAKFRYADGSVVDCSVSEVVFRRVKGITTFKMYLQTPRYEIGKRPEWSEVGSGGELYFEDIAIDLSSPIDLMGQYASSDPLRGHFGAFEFGANLKGVHFRNIDIRFHADRYPLSHLITVGPKSCTLTGSRGQSVEVFDPYVNCRVEDVTLENIRTSGAVPKELVHVTSFDDVDGDGRSSGRGTVTGLQVEGETMNPRADGWKMFDRRIGMFVHWGIYSVGGIHEQERMRRGIPRADYEKCADRFTAEMFDADKFVVAAKSLGADYIVFTSKHHDGFCMWDTQTTDFKVTNTPCGRDVLKELADACRRGGIKLGLYYSNPDWHHPNAYNALSSHQTLPEKGDVPDMEKYRAYVRAQVTELLTNYGEIVCFFWDIPTKIEDPEMNALVRRLQPNIKINDRGWGSKGDYSTPEREVPEGSLFPCPTEACDSVGADSWGYRANEDYRTVGYLTRSIDAILSMGGNYLLNVGPKADGTIPAESLDLLSKTGDWYGRVRESYRDVETVTNLVSDASCFTTVRGKTVYLHYPKGLTRRGLDLSPMTQLPKTATLLNTGKTLAYEVVPMPRSVERLKHPCLHVTGIPADELANESVVIKLEFNGEVKAGSECKLIKGKEETR